MKRGFTLMETIIVIAVVMIISTIVLRSYSLFNTRVALKSDIGKIASVLYKAKSDTISGRDGLQYGVHFETGKVVLFQGVTYSAGAPTNKDFLTSLNISITDINLAGGGSEVVFQKLTGVTNEPGSVKIVSGVNNASSTINISNTGIITVQ